jgi:hypothetical protein
MEKHKCDKGEKVCPKCCGIEKRATELCGHTDLEKMKGMKNGNNN